METENKHEQGSNNLHVSLETSKVKRIHELGSSNKYMCFQAKNRMMCSSLRNNQSLLIHVCLPVYVNLSELLQLSETGFPHL